MQAVTAHGIRAMVRREVKAKGRRDTHAGNQLVTLQEQTLRKLEQLEARTSPPRAPMPPPFIPAVSRQWVPAFVSQAALHTIPAVPIVTHSPR